MLFNSIQFIFFFPIVTLIFFLLPHKFRWIHLLAASCYFYMAFIPEYILVLGITILIDYAAGIWIEKSTGNSRKTYLILSIISTCLVLGIFKYYNFFTENIILVFNLFHIRYPGRELHIILPIGLSFHTFQSLSYVIEVYRGNQKAERNFGIYSLYVMFYPQLVTGPIERPQNLLVSLREKKYFNYENVANGLRLILFGLFVKMVIADNLAVYVDKVYETPGMYNSVSIFTGLVFYSFQIYSDFYGYSLIAIGCALVMGYKLMDNFRTPYLSRNINEFWQRWHISLSSWFRDYLYIPLGGNQVKYLRWALNILVVFMLSGFWHGASWNFVLWGALFGFAYLVENTFNRWFKLKNIESSVFFNGLLSLKTFLIITIIWVFFRGQNIQQISGIFHSLFSNFQTGQNLNISSLVWVFLFIFVFLDIFLFDKRFDSWCGEKPVTVRWMIYASLIFCTIVFSSIEQFPFIYFQF